MRLGKYFTIQEFVPPEIYNVYGRNSIWFVDPVIIDCAINIRSYFNKPMYINNWHISNLIPKGMKKFRYRGFRPSSCEVGAKLSQHKRGTAIDFNIRDRISGFLDSEEIKEVIKKKRDSSFPNINFMERSTSGWVHIDSRTTNSDKLLIL